MQLQLSKPFISSPFLKLACALGRWCERQIVSYSILSLLCCNSFAVSPNSAFIHMIVSQHVSAYQNFSHLGISRYIEIWHSKLHSLSCGLCKIWMYSISRLFCLLSSMFFYWFCHLKSRGNWFVTAVPFNHTIGFCSSLFISNITNYSSVG